MGIGFTNKVKAIELSSFDSSNLTGSYQALNGSGLEEACFLVRIINASDTDVTLSYDGSTDNDFLTGTASLVPNSTLILDFEAEPAGGGYIFLPKGTVISGKGSGGTGNIYIAGYYREVG